MKVFPMQSHFIPLQRHNAVSFVTLPIFNDTEKRLSIYGDYLTDSIREIIKIVTCFLAYKQNFSQNNIMLLSA